jgi:uncharacterized membrane protein YjjB (DUF3815 family)
MLDRKADMTSTIYPIWAKILAVPILAICFTIQFRLPREKAAYITVLFANMIAFVCTTYLKRVFGNEAAGLTSSFLVGVIATVYSYFTRRPRLLIISCAIFSLLPCYLSGAGMRSLLMRDPSEALANSLSMITVSIAIVMGFIASEFVIPSRRRQASVVK